MGIKYSMEGFINYLKINTVGNLKRGFTNHNASGRSLILRLVITDRSIRSLDTEGHQMGIKYSMEGFINYLKINTVGNLKRGFTNHNASGRSLILRLVITIADDKMQDQH